MYSTCIFCRTSLGTNESIEHFPVGRRLAFDAAKGRLWAVCKSCERWNLTPLDERWEAIDECERLFSDAKLRMSTEHVGLAKLREGLTLVRIGAPQRPELAAWRYGDQFGRRRRRSIAVGAAVAVGAGGLIIAGPVTGLVGASAIQLYNIFNLGNMVRQHRTVARLAIHGQRIGLNRFEVQRISFRWNAEHGFELSVPWRPPLRLFRRPAFKEQWSKFSGDDALEASRIILPRINASGGNERVVSSALDLLDRHPEPTRLFTHVVQRRPQSKVSWLKSDMQGRPTNWLSGFPVAERLAMEMALHESDERLALEGELTALEARWKEAEEIAAISDDLFVPQTVSNRMQSMKSGERVE